MKLEAREVGEIKEKEPECTPIRSSSKKFFIKCQLDYTKQQREITSVFVNSKT